MHETDFSKELEKCVRCGSCKAYCPTYDEDLSEAMGARGRLTLLRGLMTNELRPTPLLRERIFSCILCGACEKRCPPEVKITEAMYYGRKLLMPSDRRRRYLRLLTRFSVRRPHLSYRIARMVQHAVSPYLQRKGLLPFELSVPPGTLRDVQHVYKPERKIGRVALFTGCSVNFALPYLGMSLINVLLKMGYEVILPKGEVCCGAPLRSLGMEDEAAELAQKNYDTFSRLNAEAILSLCPTCMLTIKSHYPALIGKGIEKTMDVSDFLLKRLKPDEAIRLQGLKSVAYHDPCHLKYSVGITDEPRELIRLMGTELRQKRGDGCCGFGGVFSLDYRDVSRRLLRKRVDDYVGTGADAVVTACPGCMLQLSSGIKNMPVYHLIELVEEALEASQRSRSKERGETTLEVTA